MELSTIIVWIGAYQVAFWLVRFFQIFYRQIYGVQATTERYGVGSWAVVTGCTDGIGKECAKQLAQAGFNIVLVSRSLEKLNATAKELQQIGDMTGKEVKTRVIVLDMTAQGSQRSDAYEKIFTENLSDIDISILVNNAGYAHVGPFCAISDDDVHKQLTCNTYPMVLLTHQVIKSFRQRYEKIRKRSLLISTSSIAGVLPIPNAASYSASKRFVDFMTWALREELSVHGVDVCAWQPGTVSTKMTSFSKGAGAYTPEAFTKQALARCTSGATAGTLKHDLLYAFILFLSEILPISLILSATAKRMQKVSEKVRRDREQAEYQKLD